MVPNQESRLERSCGASCFQQINNAVGFGLTAEECRRMCRTLCRTFGTSYGAVLIVSAVEGVQAHTETLWRALEELRLPTLIMINKLDRMGADHQAVLAEIKRELTPHCLPLQQVRDEATSGAGLICTWSADLYACGRRDPGDSCDPSDQRDPHDSRDPGDPHNPFIQSLVESIIEVIASSTTDVSDDELLEKYLAGESLSFDTLQSVISNQTAAANS